MTRKKQAFVPVLVAGLLILTGAIIYNFAARAATAGFRFATSVNSYQVGETVQVGVYENSDNQCTNVVQADITYPSNLLELKSINSTGSKFDSTIGPNQTSTPGEISIVQYTTRKECGPNGTISGVSGDQLIANVSFTVKAAGTAILNFKNSSIAVSSTDNNTNVAPASASFSITLTAAPGPNPTPTPTPTPPPSAPTPTPQTPVTTIKPKGATTGVPLVNNDVLKVTAPVTVQPFTVQPDGIIKIEYILDGKVAATVTTAPYSYNLDTTKLLNGSHTLATKTYYANGQTKSVSQTIVADNPFGWQQVKLRVQKSAWLIILTLLVIGAAMLALLIHRRSDGPADYYGTGGGMTVGDDAHQEFVGVAGGNVVKPNGDEAAEALLEERIKSKAEQASTVVHDDEQELRAIESEPGKGSTKHRIKVVKPIKHG